MQQAVDVIDHSDEHQKDHVPAWQWPVVLGALWLTLVMVFVVIKPDGYAGPGLCMFHNVTGVPCPTCGGTRAVLALGRGEVIEALRWNPLVIVAMTAGVVWFAGRAVLGERARIEVTGNGRRLLWCAVAMLGMANWAWVIAQGN